MIIYIYLILKDIILKDNYLNEVIKGDFSLKLNTFYHLKPYYIFLTNKGDNIILLYI